MAPATEQQTRVPSHHCRVSPAHATLQAAPHRLRRGMAQPLRGCAGAHSRVTVTSTVVHGQAPCTTPPCLIHLSDCPAPAGVHCFIPFLLQAELPQPVQRLPRAACHQPSATRRGRRRRAAGCLQQHTARRLVSQLVPFCVLIPGASPAAASAVCVRRPFQANPQLTASRRRGCRCPSCASQRANASGAQRPGQRPPRGERRRRRARQRRRRRLVGRLPYRVHRFCGDRAKTVA